MKKGKVLEWDTFIYEEAGPWKPVKCSFLYQWSILFHPLEFTCNLGKQKKIIGFVCFLFCFEKK